MPGEAGRANGWQVVRQAELDWLYWLAWAGRLASPGLDWTGLASAGGLVVLDG